MSRRKNPNRKKAFATFRPLLEDLEERLTPTGGTSSPTYMLPSWESFNGGSLTPIGYTPAQIIKAYEFDLITFGGIKGDGTGQTIAIVDAYDDPAFVDSTSANFATSDLAMFDKQFGIPNPPSFTKFNQNGSAVTANLPGVDPIAPGGDNWEGEESLDIEWAHALAPGANIDIIECNDDSNANLAAGATTAASLPGVSVVSMSFGGAEDPSDLQSDSVYVTPAGHQGVTFLASTGDNGSPGGYPAYSPNVVAVGGTSLYLNRDNSYNYETGWGNGAASPTLGGGGGGTSLYEPEPTYQESVQSTGFRTIPDVSFEADPNTGVAVYDSYNNADGSGPWVVVGGTSLACPSWGALIAITDQGRVIQGEGTMDGASQTLPYLYSLPSTAFHDILTGNNGAYSAGPGYDEVTGRGSPIAPVVAGSFANKGIITISPATIPGGTVGVAYSQTITATAASGTTTLTYTTAGGAIPSGISFSIKNNKLTISGTPKATGTYRFDVNAKNVAAGVTSTESIGYTLTIYNPVSITTNSPLPTGTVGISYSQDLFTTGGNGINTWSITAVTGKLPGGLSFVPFNTTSDLGVVGTPTVAGTFVFKVTLADSVGSSVSKNYTLTVLPAFALNIPSANEPELPEAVIGQLYNQSIFATGGSGTYTLTYTVTGGYIPAGLVLNQTSTTVKIGGIPTGPGQVDFRVVAIDSGGAVVTQNYVLAAEPGFSLSPSTLPAGNVGSAYSQSITASGGVGAMTVAYSLIGSTMPSSLGLTFGVSGNTLSITGTPTAAGTLTFNVIGTDSNGAKVIQGYTVAIEPAFALTASIVPGGTVGQLYNQAISVTNTTLPYTLTYAITSGNIPAGINFFVTTSNIELAMTGTPTASGSVTFIVTAIDSQGDVAMQTFTLTVAAALQFNLNATPAFTQNIQFSYPIFTTGGTGTTSLTYSLISGTVPPGLTVVNTSNEVEVVGAATKAGSFTFEVTAVDSVGATISKLFTMSINNPVTLPAMTFPAGTAKFAYSQTIVPSGGTGYMSYNYSLLSGAIPQGILIQEVSNNLVVGGTPQTAGSFKIKVIGTDLDGSIAIQTYSFVINAPIVFSRTTLPLAALGVAYNQTITASGGTGALTLKYTIVSGTLPPGLILTVSGNKLIITGKAQLVSTLVIAVTETDSIGAFLTTDFTLMS